MLALAAVGACGFDTDRAAPYVAAGTSPGACGTTESLFPKLLAFVRADRFAPLRTVIERRLVPSEANPTPDPSLRTLVRALVRFMGSLGLDRTKVVADLLAQGDLDEDLSPLLVTMLRFMGGDLGGATHYQAADAAALFLRQCRPDPLLTAVEDVLRLESPSHQEPWLLALVDEAAPLLREPTFEPFLEGFEQEGASGRPAVVSLVTQIMILVADEGFRIERIHTLLESAVYPAVRPELRARIEVLVGLLDEATRPEAGILEPLQGALRCGLQHPAPRDDLIGFLYDLMSTEEVDLVGVLETAGGLVSRESARAELGLFADAVRVVRTDLTIRDDLRELVATLLSSPDVELSVPVLTELIDGGVVAELIEAMATLLDGCGRETT